MEVKLGMLVKGRGKGSKDRVGKASPVARIPANILPDATDRYLQSKGLLQQRSLNLDKATDKWLSEHDNATIYAFDNQQLDIAGATCRTTWQSASNDHSLGDSEQLEGVEAGLEEYQEERAEIADLLSLESLSAEELAKIENTPDTSPTWGSLESALWLLEQYGPSDVYGRKTADYVPQSLWSIGYQTDARVLQLESSWLASAKGLEDKLSYLQECERMVPLERRLAVAEHLGINTTELPQETWETVLSLSHWYELSNAPYLAPKRFVRWLGQDGTGNLSKRLRAWRKVQAKRGLMVRSSLGSYSSLMEADKPVVTLVPTKLEANATRQAKGKRIVRTGLGSSLGAHYVRSDKPYMVKVENKPLVELIERRNALDSDSDSESYLDRQEARDARKALTMAYLAQPHAALIADNLPPVQPIIERASAALLRVVAKVNEIKPGTVKTARADMITSWAVRQATATVKRIQLRATLARLAASLPSAEVADGAIGILGKVPACE